MMFATKTILNPGQEDEFECYGYRRHLGKSIVAHVISILLCGIPYLIAYWKPDWKVAWYRSPCPLFAADTVLLHDVVGLGHHSAVIQVKVTPVGENFPRQYTHRSRCEGRIAVHSETPLLSSTSSSSSSSGCSGSSSGDDTEPLWSPVKLTMRSFEHHHVKYLWNARQKVFVRLHGYDVDTPVNRFASELSRGLTEEMQMVKKKLFGSNTIDVEVKPYHKLLFEEVLNPFYIFQLASIVLWSFDEYYYYASCIFFISIVSVVVSLLETRRQSQSLHDMVSSSNELKCTVYRGNDTFQDISSVDLVPGDVLAIPAHGCLMPCDAVLVAGTCIVNESMLTGESVPVTKAALPQIDHDDEEIYDPERHKRHTLFSGTAVIQTRYYGQSHVLAVVVRTGFATAKGGLIRSILYPKPIGFKFYRDSIRFVSVLFCVAAVGMVYCIYVYIVRGSDPVMVLLRCLDIITIVVPPALPAAMTVGTYYAQSRLKKASIFCISPQRINVCGKLKLVCFDKTGTLTEDGLDLYGILPTDMAWQLDYSQDTRTDPTSQFEPVEKDVTNLPNRSPMVTCLAACHSLTLIDDDLTGDPLDIKMFESTDWLLEEEGQDNAKFDMLMPSVVKPKSSCANLVDTFNDEAEEDYPYEVGIIRQFTFSSSVARMSVITRALGDNHFHVYTKGAPEKLEELCIPETIPKDYHEQLRVLTLKGFRVISLAHKRLGQDINWLKAQKMKRDKAESQLVFLGFLVMQNTLKPQTKPVIKQLLDANIRTVMVTGDNLLTGISVARDCHMVSPNDTVLVVEVTPPTDTQPATVRFEQTEDSVSANDTFQFVDLNSMEQGIAKSAQYHFAMSGKTWALAKQHFSHVLPKLIQRGTVFARMSPDQKAQLVEELQAIDYVVSMCGDGANDCGALKAAHVGISLSEAEASVAAPFTSRVADITCVPTVIREGRCALVTSFGVFKYMALYSMVQFISVLLLYTLKTNLGDEQFLYIDLVITTTVAVLMGWTGAHEKLVKQRPPGSLVAGPNLVSIFTQIFVTLAVQVGAYMYLRTMPWYVPLHPATPETEIILCWETTTIFTVSAFQYLILAGVFSKGKPFRKPFYTNVPFLVALITLSLFTVLLAIYPGESLADFLQLMFDPDQPMQHIQFRFSMILFAAGNLTLSIAIEKLIVETRWMKRVTHFLARKKQPKNKFKRIQREMDMEDWPPASLQAEQSLLLYSDDVPR